MIKIEVMKSLAKEIKKKFNKKDRRDVRNLFESLKSNLNKGKTLTNIGNIVLKELKYKSFRFYFILDGHKLKFIDRDILIKFIAMSDKKTSTRSNK